MLLLFSLLTTSSPVLAQATTARTDQHQAFTFQTGWFWTDEREHVDSTWTFNGRAAWGPVPHLGFELTLGYLQGRQKHTQLVYSGFTPRLSALLIVLPRAPVQPFVAVDVGMFYQSVWGNLANPDMDFMAGGGVGAFAPVFGPLAFRADLRGLVNSGKELDGTRQPPYVNLEFTIGLALRLTSETRDRDSDGIYNRVDICPDDPEDRDYFEDHDGCPDWDNDKDRLPDPIDKCPNDPEDRDGFRDDDGCPDPDDDNDGIEDAADSCPRDAEDQDGFEDSDGCPDHDNDDDRVPDLRDACPGVPEDFDEWQDQDGCPEDDNDGDGLPDARDECPNAAEDQDGFGDIDGCPEDDNDADGIGDLEDNCPGQPEDHDGYRDGDGCPDEDNDNDGALDVVDRCPDEAEDRDGFMDEDGCPELDNDHDGIPDLQDRCPLDPEDVDGYQDEDGCIDPDNDGDGIPDVIEDCPDVPETYNGFEDRDGCPDELPPEVKQFTGVIQGIYFEVGSDRIKAESYSILDRAASVLKDYPGIRMKVEGHTDSDGGDDYNLDLSERRAMAVGQYLINAGVDPSRVEWEGFGEARPIASNQTADGKAQNRRVEFHVINPDAPVVPQ